MAMNVEQSKVVSALADTGVHDALFLYIDTMLENAENDGFDRGYSAGAGDEAYSNSMSSCLVCDHG